MIDSLRGSIEGVANTLTAMVNQCGMEMDAGTYARYELAFYLMYLSSVDGTISSIEEEMISTVFGQELSGMHIEILMKTKELYPQDIEHRIPITIKLMNIIDNRLLQLGDDSNVAGMLIDLYESMGNLMINSAIKSSENEVINHMRYIQMLKDWHSTHQGDICSLTDEDMEMFSDFLEESSDNGVKAPRKE